MCQEYHCICCPDDLPQISCECIDCVHDNSELKTQINGVGQEFYLSSLDKKNGQVSSPKDTACTMVDDNQSDCCSKQETCASEAKKADNGCCMEKPEDTDKCSKTTDCCKPIQNEEEDSCPNGKISNIESKKNENEDSCDTKRCCNDTSLDENVSSCSGESNGDLPSHVEDSFDTKTCCPIASKASCDSKKEENNYSDKNDSSEDGPLSVGDNRVAEDTKEPQLNENVSCCPNGKDDPLGDENCGKENPKEKVSLSSTIKESLIDEDCSAEQCCGKENPMKQESSCYTEKKEKQKDDECNTKTCCGVEEPQGEMHSEENTVDTKPFVENDCTKKKCSSREKSEEVVSSCGEKKTVDDCSKKMCCEKYTQPIIEETCVDEMCCQDTENLIDKTEAEQTNCSKINTPKQSSDSADSCSKKTVKMKGEETILLIEPADQSKQHSHPPNLTTRRRSTTKLRVQNICCPKEATMVEECLKPLEGIESVNVNVIGRVVHVRHDPEVTSPTEMVDCLNKVHLGATVMEVGSAGERSDGKVPRVLVMKTIYVIVQAVLLLTAVCAVFLEKKWYQWFAIAEIIFGIGPIVKNSFYAVKSKRIDINILMFIAIIGTIAISEWVEGATVIFVFAVADALQEFCMFRVQRTISKLMLKRPEVAVLVETGQSVPIEDVAIGTLIAIRPGEMIPLDGVVVKGRAAVDESSITGESLPVEKTVMSRVFSGTVNQNGYLEVETTSDSSSSTVSKVAQLVQEAQSSSTQTEAIINRFAKYYTPLVVVIAALLVIVPAILGAAGVGTYLQDIREWGRRALVMLVISCPCALVMATPIAVVCTITAAARKGALVKGGEYLETLSNLQVLAFDKTGTLTEGKFQVTNIECVNGQNEREALRLAAGLESKTVHPIAAAIVNEFSGCIADMVQNQTVQLPEVSQFSIHEGQGISGHIEGKRVRVGNKAMLDECGASLNDNMSSKYQQWSNESKTVVFVCIEENVASMIALADEIRPNTTISLEWLRNLGVQTSMITGDNKRTAQAVKAKLTVDECVSEMKPQDKLQWIKDKQLTVRDEDESQSRCCFKRSHDNHVIVGMVGDGVNDGPALASANVGIAMGAGGTALAVEAADVALMSNNLAKIPELITLSKFSNRVVKQNIAASLLLKVAIVIVAFAGYVQLWMAVVADVVGLLVVILNGLRPLKWKVSKTHRKGPVDVELGAIKRPGYNYENPVALTAIHPRQDDEQTSTKQDKISI